MIQPFAAFATNGTKHEIKAAGTNIAPKHYPG
jgi:hypothetical protein